MKPLVALLSVFATCGLADAADATGRNGSIVLAQAPEVCTQVYMPVCGTDAAGKRITYSNACFARAANATDVTPGECPK